MPEHEEVGLGVGDRLRRQHRVDHPHGVGADSLQEVRERGRAFVHPGHGALELSREAVIGPKARAGDQLIDEHPVAIGQGDLQPVAGLHHALHTDPSVEPDRLPRRDQALVELPTSGQGIARVGGEPRSLGAGAHPVGARRRVEVEEMIDDRRRTRPVSDHEDILASEVLDVDRTVPQVTGRPCEHLAGGHHAADPGRSRVSEHPRAVEHRIGRLDVESVGSLHEQAKAIVDPTRIPRRLRLAQRGSTHLDDGRVGPDVEPRRDGLEVVRDELGAGWRRLGHVEAQPGEVEPVFGGEHGPGREQPDVAPLANVVGHLVGFEDHDLVTALLRTHRGVQAHGTRSDDDDSHVAWHIAVGAEPTTDGRG